VQQPRIPLWVVGIWPRRKSMQRILKCDGVLLEKMSREGKPEAVTPSDVHEVKAFVDANRMLSSPFDIVVQGKTDGMGRTEQQEKLLAWQVAGATWWVETLFDSSEGAAEARISQGPPQL